MVLTPVVVTLLGFIGALAALAGTFLIVVAVRASSKRAQPQ
ncbi:MAG: hypothetical protein WD076_10335 [Parvularculaceae bacterium]